MRINLIKDDKLEAIMEDLFNEDDEDEDIEMSIDDFEVLGLIGRGSFGKILLAIDSEDRKVALKVLKKSTVLMTEDGVEDIFKEKRILQLQNRFKSTAYYTFQDSDFLYMGMKYIAAGDLFSNMSAGKFFDSRTVCFIYFDSLFCSDSSSIPRKAVTFILAEVLLGLHYLHRHRIIYRDLKMENLLVEPGNPLMIHNI